MDEVRNLGSYDACVVGSGIYLGNGLKEARLFHRHARPSARRAADVAVRQRPDRRSATCRRRPECSPSRLAARLVEMTNARGFKVFAGNLDMSKLGLSEKAAVRGAHAREGDYRDWEEIECWATEIAAELGAERTGARGKGADRRACRDDPEAVA